MIRTSIALSAALALAAPPVLAQGKDDLWDVKTEMSMPGMPAGIPGMAQTLQVCADKDPKKAATQRPDMQDCKIGDYKQSGNRVTMTVTCPQGTATIEQTYNAARTEYKSVMKMKTNDGEMTMSSTGRKVGSCDAAQASQRQDEKMAAIQRQSSQAQAQMAATDDSQVKQCASALASMNAQGFGIYGQCTTQKEICDSMREHPAYQRSAKACPANVAEYCKHYSTMEGFLKAKGDENGARMCGVSREEVRASHCPSAAKTENLDYLGRFCLAEAKPIAQQHCVGRSFTSQVRDKYSDFCTAYLAQAGIEQPAAAAQPEAKKDAKSKVTEGVSQGINKLKGLFGR
jgi:hypothetical protein